MSTSAIQKTLGYENHTITPRLNYFKPCKKKTQQTFAQEVALSLGGPFKSISPKFFYDDKGSLLFERICSLPEYYLTRTEIGLLKQITHELASHLTGDMRLVELGSGSSIKTRLILDMLDNSQSKIEYFPIDVSDIIKDSCRQLLYDYTKLHITGIIDTYHGGLELIKEYDETPNLIIFLGSSFGNFEENDGFDFLQKINSSMKDSDLFLIGLDLVKNRDILENAYDDSQKITADFNLNVLSRMNKELGANFDLLQFSHVVKFNEEKKRIEMYLKSNKNQRVLIPECDMEFSLYKNELIHTEHSHKYSIPGIKKLFSESGFKIHALWQNKDMPYALVLCSI